MSSLRTLALSVEERKRVTAVSELAGHGAASLGALLERLDDPSWAVRRAVVAALASMGDPALPRLVDLLVHHRGNEARVAATVDALVASRGDVDLVIVPLAESSDPAIVCDAAQILGRRKTSGAVPILAALTTAADDNVALAAIEALGRIGDDAALTPLIDALEGRNFFRAFPAIDVLGRAGSARAVRPLIAMLSEPHYAGEAARALGRIGDPSAVVPLTALLVKSKATMVRTAVIAIGEIYDRQLERFGATGAMDGALAQNDLHAAMERIVQCLPQADATERAALVRVLGWIGGEDAALFLVDLLTGDHAAATAAVAALGRLGAVVQPQLLLALRDADSARRQMILPLLRHTTEAAAPIAECLEDPSPRVRALSCDALARIGDTRVVARIFTLLNDPDLGVMQNAVAAIQSLGCAETERLALEAAGSPEPRARGAGLRVAAYFGYPSAIELLIAAVSDPDERIRDTAIFGLPYLDDPRAIEALLGATAHASPRTRAAGMRAIGQAPKQSATITSLHTGLHDPDAWVRYFACQALSRLKDEGSADAIASLLSDPAGQVRVAVIEALAHLRGARALDALHRAARGDDPDVQRAALLGLGHVKDHASLSVLREALVGVDAATRLVAISALAEYDLAEISKDLGAALSDADESVRSAAIALLAARPGPEATAVLLSHLTDSHLKTRIVAALAQPAEARVGVLAEALRASTPETAPLIVSALARANRADASLALAAAFTTEDAAIRRAIAPALASMSTPSSRALLVRAATQDPDAEVRQISAAATGR